MPKPRKQQVSLEATPFYHVISRCVRRAFLCGFDPHTNRSLEHRRGWIVARMKLLASIFSIDVCAYAVMSNHFHAVLRIDAVRARNWSADEVIDRWCRLFAGPLLVQQYRSGAPLSKFERDAVSVHVETWRTRLMDLSWFMRTLNEPIARQANQEDGCTGRFWEGRFKSQALLDERALLTCMSYVDLNPIRAGMAETPEASDFTSIQERIRAWSVKPAPDKPLGEVVGDLLPFNDSGRDDAIPFSLSDYLELVDWSGRAVRADKTWAIETALPPILTRLGIDGRHYLKHLRKKERTFGNAIGSVTSLRESARAFGRKFFRGLSYAEQLFPTKTPSPSG